jgi:hypothetical protein
VLQFGHVDARSHVPRGVSAPEDDEFVCNVVGGSSTFLGAPRSSSTYAEGGKVPRGKCFISPPNSTAV